MILFSNSITNMNYLSLGIFSSASFYIYHQLLNMVSSDNKDNNIKNNVEQYSLQINDFEKLLKNNYNKNQINDETTINAMCILFNGLPEEDNDCNNTTVFQIHDESLKNIGSSIYQLINTNDENDALRFIIIRNYSHGLNGTKSHKQSQMIFPLVKIKKYYVYVNSALETEQICLKLYK